MAKPVIQKQPPQAAQQPADTPGLKRRTPAAAPKQDPLELSPELEAFAILKLGRPRNLWRFLNRVVSYVSGGISRDEWDLAFDQARKAVDGKPMHPEDAARKAERMIAALLGTDDNRVSASCAKCELSETAILMAFIGRPSSAFFHSRAITLKDPGKRNG
jgi:hypothetical protein